jgi:hypothetical protein
MAFLLETLNEDEMRNMPFCSLHVISAQHLGYDYDQTMANFSNVIHRALERTLS